MGPEVETMPSVFTRILLGELPARFVWKDDQCAAFLTIAPLRPGHTLVVPRKEVDHWIDLESKDMEHLMEVSRSVAKAMQKAFEPAKVGLMIAGLEVRHVHVHLVPIDSVRDLDFDNQVKNPDPREMDEAARKIRESLRRLGFTQVADA